MAGLSYRPAATDRWAPCTSTTVDFRFMPPEAGGPIMTVPRRYVARVFTAAEPAPAELPKVMTRRPGGCDVASAIEYGFRDEPSFFPSEGPTEGCGAVRHRLLLRRALGGTPAVDLSWRAFEVCEVHLRQILRAGPPALPEGREGAPRGRLPPGRTESPRGPAIPAR